MVFLYHPWIPRGDDKMGHYVHYIGGGIVDSKIYETGNAAKSFKSQQIRMIVIISIRNTMIR